MAPINHNVPGYKNMKPAGLTLQNHPESLTPHAHAQKLGRGSTHGPVGGRGRLRGGRGGVPARARTARAHDTALTPARLSRRRPRPRPHTTVHSLPSLAARLAHTVALGYDFLQPNDKTSDSHRAYNVWATPAPDQRTPLLWSAAGTAWRNARSLQSNKVRSPPSSPATVANCTQPSLFYRPN